MYSQKQEYVGVIGLASPPNKNNYIIRGGIINIKEKYCTFDLEIGRAHV